MDAVNRMEIRVNGGAVGVLHASQRALQLVYVPVDTSNVA